MGNTNEPLLQESKRSPYRYYVPPQEEFDEALRRARQRRGPIRQAQEVYACLDVGGLGPVTLDRRPLVRVRELVYPAVDSEEIQDKWVYLFQDSKLIISAHVQGKQWNCQSHSKSKIERQWKSQHGIEIPSSLLAQGQKWGFFLSPIELTPGALDLLMREKESSLVQVSREDLKEVILLKDPTRWAADTSAQWFLPRFKQWQDWLEDAETQARLFIASVLKEMVTHGVVDNDNTFSFTNELVEGEPDRFLEKYKQKEMMFRSAAERAAAYLVHCLDAAPFRVVEQACMEQRGVRLSFCYQAWASVTPALSYVRPGREFLTRLLKKGERFPSRYIFTDRAPPNQLAFGEYRYAWQAAMAIFADLVPMVIGLLLKNALSVEDKVRKYLEQISVKTQLKGYRLAIYNNIQKEKEEKKRSILYVKKQRKRKNVDVQNIFRKLKLEAVKAIPDSPQVRLAKHLEKKLHGNFAKNFERLSITVTGLIEMINLTLAIGDFYKAQPEEQSKKGVALLGASADMSKFVLETINEMKNNGEAGRLVRRLLLSLTGVATIISGVVDGIQFMENGVEAALVRNDYAEAVGLHIALAGAAVSVLGGVMTLIGALTGGALFGGPVGIIFGIVGAVLIVGGTWLATLFKRTPYEDFAAFCWLGKKYQGGKHIFPKWSPSPLPCKSVVDEARVLVTLLSHFEVQCSSIDRLIIRPGLLYSQSVFEVYGLQTFRGYQSNSFQLRVNLETDEVEQTRGAHLAESSENLITRDEEDRVTSISIPFTLAEPRPRSRYFSLQVWVRLQVDEKMKTPLEGHWVAVDFYVNPNPLLNPGRLKASSLDYSSLVDATTFKPLST
jgi:hypothetical protein